MGKLEAITALALKLCTWSEAVDTPTYILPDQWYEQAYSAQVEKLDLSHNGYTLGFRYRVGDVVWIALRESTASERVLCHEWRHVVEGHWHD